MIKVLISDGDGKRVNIIGGNKTPAGIVAYTEKLRAGRSKVDSLINDTFGADMNQDVTFGGDPEHIHNGIDNAYWTASALSGTWDFNSATQMNTGDFSVDATATINNDTALFSDATTTDMSGFTAMTGFIYS